MVLCLVRHRLLVGVGPLAKVRHWSRGGMNIRSALLISVVKTLYLSIRFRGRIIVVRGTRIRLERGANRARPRRSPYVGSWPLYRKAACASDSDARLLDNPGHGHHLLRNEVVVGENAHLEIGDQTFVHYDAAITCWDHIAIGADCGISWNTNIIDGNAHELIIDGESQGRGLDLLAYRRPRLDRHRGGLGRGVDRRRIRGGCREAWSLPPCQLRHWYPRGTPRESCARTFPGVV